MEEAHSHSNSEKEQVAQHTHTEPDELSIPRSSIQIGVDVAATSKSAPIMEKPLLLSLSSNQTVYGTGSTENVHSDEKEEHKGGWGSRHVFAFMGFLGLSCVYAMRVNLSVAIVDMVISKTDGNDSIANSSNNQFCPFDADYNEDATNDGEFDWDGQTQGIILGCFFWGYIVTQIPGGVLASKYGGKMLFGWGVFVTAVFTLLSPIAARIDVRLFIAFRVIEGLGEGVTLPAMHVMMSRWVPRSERSSIGAFVLAGMQFGTVVAMPLTGALAVVPYDHGWPLAFYVPGALGLIWCIAWYFLVFDSPLQHPRISTKEKEYILTHVPHTEPKQIGKTPWKTILTSIHLWAILFAHMGQCWGFYTLLTELPTYMKTVLHFNLESNSTLSALPYLAMWIFSNIASWFADYLHRERRVSTTIVRKSFNTFGFFMPAVLLIGAGYSGCDRSLTVALLTLAVGTNGAVYSGFQVNHLDVASNYAGIMMGITNMAGNICGFLAPYIVSTITIDGTLSQWRLVFYISAVIYLVTNLIFVIFGTGEEQHWNRKHVDTNGCKSVVTNADKPEVGVAFE